MNEEGRGECCRQKEGTWEDQDKRKRNKELTKMPWKDDQESWETDLTQTEGPRRPFSHKAQHIYVRLVTDTEVSDMWVTLTKNEQANILLWINTTNINLAGG